MARVVIAIALVAAGSAVLFASDHALLTRVLAATDSHAATPSKSCGHPCAGGRMLLL